MMDKSEENYVLKQEKNGRPVLVDGESGQWLVVGDLFFDQEEASYCGSPTLRLNWDLSDLDLEQLKRIGQAEEFRHGTCLIRSYIQEFRPVVGVISSSNDFLEEFVDTYGGLLELQPIYVPDSSVGTIAITRSSTGLTLSFEKAYPIDLTRCNLCRACIAACEARAISPGGKIDFDLCNMCGECISACPQGAIDLHRKEEVVIEVPVLVVDTSLGLDISRDLVGMVYLHRDLTDLLKRIGSYEIQEAVIHNLEHCAYEPRLDTGCKRCLRHCPSGALKRSDSGIKIDQLRCSECGNCVAVCPTGAMEYARFEEKDLLRYLYLLGLKPGFKVVIGGKRELVDFWWHNPGKRFGQTFFLDYPQVRALGPVTFLYLLVLGATRIFILDEGLSQGESCPMVEEAGFVNNLLTRLFSIDGYVRITGSSLLAQGLMEAEDRPWPLIERMEQPLEYQDRRSCLNQLLSYLLKVSGEKELTVPYDKYARIQLSQGCCLCLSCLNVCYSGALEAEPKDFSLFFTPEKCIGCSACEQICPEKAVSILPGLLLRRDLFHRELLARDEPMRCKKCGKIFTNQKTFDRAISLLKASGKCDQETLDVLELCEDCRAEAMLKRLLGD